MNKPDRDLLRIFNNYSTNDEYCSILPCSWSIPEDGSVGLNSNPEINGLSCQSQFSSPNSLFYKQRVMIISNKPISVDRLNRSSSQKSIHEENYTFQSFENYDDIFEQHQDTSVYPNFSKLPRHRGVDSKEKIIEKPIMTKDISSVYYFEVTIDYGKAWVGLVQIEAVVDEYRKNKSELYPVIPGKVPGEFSQSIGLGSDGSILVQGVDLSRNGFKASSHNVNVEKWTESIKDGDTIGCGMELGGSYRVFFTKNGEILYPFVSSTVFQTAGNILFPCVGIATDNSKIHCNFGLRNYHDFLWKDYDSLQNYSMKKEDERIFQSVRLCQHTSTSFDSREHVTRRIEKDSSMEMQNSPSKVDIENATELAKNLENAVCMQGVKGIDPGYIENLVQICEQNQRQVKEALETECNPDYHALICLNDYLIQVLQSSKPSLPKESQVIKSEIVDEISPVSTALDNPQTNVDLINRSMNTTSFCLKMNSYSQEVHEVVKNNDFFSLICLLRVQGGKRFEAAWALMKYAKNNKSLDLRGEIRSSGGMHSLLTLFKSKSTECNLKLVAALAVSYLLPSFTDPAGLTVGYFGLRVAECLQYLLNATVFTKDSELYRSDIVHSAALALTHMWLNLLEPSLSEVPALALKDLDHSNVNKDSITNLRHATSYLVKRGEPKNDPLEIQELLEITVSLIVDLTETVMTKDICEENMQNMNSMRNSAACMIESICKVERTRPIAVRAGLLRVLVSWMDSGNIDLQRPAANALRDLTKPNDEYIAGWIHSQIVNEGALSSIVQLSASDAIDVCLPIAQILSSLTIAPHTRAAMVDAKGIQYLVQLLVKSSEHTCEHEKLFLAAGSSLLQLGASAVKYARGWTPYNVGAVASLNRRDDVINDIIQFGAIKPFVSMVNSGKRGKLRMLSVEAICVLSDDEKPGRRTREILCEAGIAQALGNVLLQNVGAIYKMIQKSNSDVKGTSAREILNEEILIETYQSLHAFANILEPVCSENDKWIYEYKSHSTAIRNYQSTLSTVCEQSISSGGLDSILLIASLPIASGTLKDETNLRLQELVVESCRSIASISPHILAHTVYAKWCVKMIRVLAEILQQTSNIENGNDIDILREVQLSALRGTAILAECEPIKVTIIDKCLPQLLQFKNLRGEGESARLSGACNQVCSALGFTDDEMDVKLAGNDPKLLAEWFSIERSMLLQAMARDEVKKALYRMWKPVFVKMEMHEIKGVLRRTWENSYMNWQDDFFEDDEHGMDMSKYLDTQLDLNKTEPSSFLKQIFKNIGLDDDTILERENLLEQYTNIYGELKNEGCNSKTNAFFLEKEKHLKDSVSKRSNLLNSCSLSNIGSSSLVEWLLSFQRSRFDDSILSEDLSTTIKDLLNIYFPSKLLLQEVLPLSDISLKACFDFRAIQMPCRQYFSFRREGQVVSRICDKYASSIESEGVYWTLGFSNSCFDGEFAETLVQTLYRYPIIQALSFSTKNIQCLSGNFTHGDDIGSMLLVNLAGSLPPWVSWLTFDNVLSKEAFKSLISMFDTRRKSEIVSGTFQKLIKEEMVSEKYADYNSSNGSYRGHGHWTFQGFAIKDSPHLGKDSFYPFFNLLSSNDRKTIESEKSPLEFLKSLDLSGNKLGDECIADLLNIIYSRESSCSIESLDASGNNVRKGKRTIEAFRKHHELRNCEQRNSQFLVSSKERTQDTSLKKIYLASNDLCPSILCELMKMLENNGLDIHTLDLSDNNFSDNDKLLHSMTYSVFSNTNLLELDLSGNCFSHYFIEEYIRIMKKAFSFNLAFVKFELNNPPLNKHHIKEITELCVQGRMNRLRQTQLQKISEKPESNISNPSFDSFTKLSEQYQSSQNSESSASLDSFDEKVDSLVPKKPGENPSLNITSHNKTATVPGIKNENKKKRKEGSNQIKVLTSGPLVWKDANDQFQPFEALDFELERALLFECFREAQMDIDLSFDNATTERLQAAVTRRCPCLHFSGHGHPKFLSFEDGKGGLHCVFVDDLKNLVTMGVSGDKAPFQFVFVSACYSGLAGETFVNAGVPHVVCCQQESQLMDSAALVFTRAFYLALALGHTVKDSFVKGTQAVAVAPSVPNPKEEMKKFVLLPEDGDHDCPVFDAEKIDVWPPVKSRLASIGTRRKGLLHRQRTSIMGSAREYDIITSGNALQEVNLPTPPQSFFGREIDMYKVLNAILDKRFVNIVGPSGMGRSSLTAALCQYINQRRSTIIEIEVIFYVYVKKSKESNRMSSFIDALYDQVKKITFSSSNYEVENKVAAIFNALRPLKALVVFDKLDVLDGSDEKQDFALFLSSLFRETKSIRVLTNAHRAFGLSSLGCTREWTYTLGPLNFLNTVKLFANQSPFIHTGEERRKFIEQMMTTEEQSKLCINDKGIDQRTKTILNVLGEGIPSRTFDEANNMNKENFEKLSDFFDNGNV